MATTTAPERVTLTIPADYLEDVRTALIREIEEDGEFLRIEQAAVLEGGGQPGNREDLASTMGRLVKDIQLLECLLDTTAATELTAEEDTLAEMLQTMARILAGRLAEEIKYAPLSMGAVRELADRLRWTADEAVRIEPALDEKGRVAAVPTVTLTRNQRDVLREDVGYSFSGEGGDLHLYVEAQDITRAQEIIRVLATANRILEQIGWEERGDRDSYRLTVDAEIADYGRGLAARGRAALEDDRRNLGKSTGLAAGDENYTDPSETEEFIETDRTTIEVGDLIAAVA